MAKANKKTSNIIPINSRKKKESLSLGAWLPITAVLILPVLINPWGFNRFALPKITFLQIVLLVFIFKTLFNLAKGRAADFTVGRWAFPYGVFLIVALVSALFSIHPVTAFFGQTNRYDGLTSLISYAAFGLFVSSTVKNRADLRGLHWSLLLGLLIVSSLAVLQHFGVGVQQWNAPSDIGRVFSTIGNSNLLGAYIALLLPTLLSFYIAPELKRNDFIWVAWIALPLVLAALIFSATRGAWIGSFFALLAFFYFLLRKGRAPAISKKIIVIPVIVILLVSAIVLATKPSDTKIVSSYLERAKSIFTMGTSAQYRINIWKLTFKMIADKPVLGSGPDTFKENFFHYRFPQFDKDLPADKAHSDFLQISSTAGLLGLSAFLWFVIYFFYSFLRLQRSAWDKDLTVIGAAYISGIIGYLISIQFSFSLPTVTPMFWVAVGGVTSIAGISGASDVKKINYKAAKKHNKFLYAGIFAALILSVFSIRNIVSDRYVDAAMVYQAGGDYGAALQDIETAGKVNSTEESYYNIKAKMLLSAAKASKKKNLVEEAIKVYKQSKKINPYDEEAYFGLNAAYYEASKLNIEVREEAIKNVEELLKIAPKSSKANQFLTSWRSVDIKK